MWIGKRSCTFHLTSSHLSAQQYIVCIPSLTPLYPMLTFAQSTKLLSLLLPIRHLRQSLFRPALVIRFLIRHVLDKVLRVDTLGIDLFRHCLFGFALTFVSQFDSLSRPTDQSYLLSLLCQEDVCRCHRPSSRHWRCSACRRSLDCGEVSLGGGWWMSLASLRHALLRAWNEENTSTNSCCCNGCVAI